MSPGGFPSPLPGHDGTIDRLLRLLDACGIAEAVCFAPFPHQFAGPGQNAWLAAELTKRRRLYVYAGGGNTAFQGPFFADLWYLDLDSDTWQRAEAGTGPGARPAARIKAAMAYDEAGEHTHNARATIIANQREGKHREHE